MDIFLHFSESTYSAIRAATSLCIVALALYELYWI